MPTVYDHPRLCVSLLMKPPCWPGCGGINPYSTVCLYAKSSSLQREDIRGDYRVENAGLVGCELYRGVDAEADLSAAPWETFSTLPHESAALDVSHTYHFVLRYRNAYNLVSQNVAETIVIVAADGSQTEPNPSAPDNVAIEAAAAGTAQVTAQYFYLPDGLYAADTWLIYFTDDGADPVPGVDTPTEVAMVHSDGIAKLDWTSPAADHNDTIKVIVQTRRSGDTDYDSTNTDIVSCTASTSGPAAPTGHTFIGRTSEQAQ